MSKNKRLVPIEEARKELKALLSCIDFALKALEKDGSLKTILDRTGLDSLYEQELNIECKKDREFKEEPMIPAAMLLRSRSSDRTMPVESVTLNEFEQKHEKEAGGAVIHTGMYADEYARSFHALALVVGTDIYFRNGAYKPETEEGRKTIAHELTHVAQHKSRPLADNRTREELEAEAEEAERTERPPTEPIVVIRAGRRQYRMRRSEAARLDAYTEREVEDWIEREKDMMPDREYARLLKAYRRYLDGREQGRRPWTKG